MLQQVRSTIRTHALLAKGEHLLLAVSGGADSVAMTHALARLAGEYELRLTLAHLHHGIRGESADGDLAFVQELARRLDLPCVWSKTQVPARARRKRISLEMAAREARHVFFKRTMRRTGAQRIALAHTADDQAETVLLRLLRGAGPDGLAGIPYSTRLKDMLLVRPLLDVSRAQILRFLRRDKAAWREDETNRDLTILRNRVRHDLLPLLEQHYNPGIRDTLRRCAEILATENRYLTELAAEILVQARTHNGNGIRIQPLKNAPRAVRRRAVRTWLAENGLPPQTITRKTVQQVEELIGAGRGGRRIRVPGNRRITHRYATLHIADAAHSNPPLTRPRAVTLPGETLLPELGLRVHAEFATGLCKEARQNIGNYPARATLARAMLRRRKLFMRTWQAGDRFTPLGLAGTKKLQDIFVDAKVPREDRARLPLLVCAGTIIWVPGYTIARDWQVRNEQALNIQIRIDPL